MPGVGDHDGQGGSGGGGGYSRTIVPVIPRRTYLVTVGVGGSPEAQGGNTEFSDGPVLSATPLVRSTGGQPGGASTGVGVSGEYGVSCMGDSPR